MMAKFVMRAITSELHLCKHIADDVCVGEKLSVPGDHHNRLTLSLTHAIFPALRVHVSIPSTESGNDAGSVAKGK
jgi:hypothetical protein